MTELSYDIKTFLLLIKKKRFQKQYLLFIDKIKIS